MNKKDKFKSFSVLSFISVFVTAILYLISTRVTSLNFISHFLKILMTISFLATMFFSYISKDSNKKKKK